MAVTWWSERGEANGSRSLARGSRSHNWSRFDHRRSRSTSSCGDGRGCHTSIQHDSAAMSTWSWTPLCDMAQGILDTSTLILLGRITATDALPTEPLITSITLAELSVGPLVAATSEERAARQAHLQQAEADFDPLPFDAAAARSFGQVAASLRRAGRKPSARAYDAMIAAICIANDMPIHTCNADDFAGIAGLLLVDVPHPGVAEPAS